MTSHHEPSTHRSAVRGSRAALATAIVLAATLGATASPALAHGSSVAVVAAGPHSNLAYSADGVEYSATFPAIFTTATKLVPGEGVAESVWIRNDNAMAVTVSLAVPASAVPNYLLAGLVPSSVVTLAAGVSSELQARVWLPESAGNQTQGQSLPVTLRVNVSEVASAGHNDGGGTDLGDTGGTQGMLPVGLAVLLGGVGAFLASRKRSVRPANPTVRGGS